MIGKIRIFMVVEEMVEIRMQMIKFKYMLMKMKNGWKRRMKNLLKRIVERMLGFRIRKVGKLKEG